MLGKCHKGLQDRAEALKAFTTALNLDAKVSLEKRTAQNTLLTHSHRQHLSSRKLWKHLTRMTRTVTRSRLPVALLKMLHMYPRMILHLGRFGIFIRTAFRLWRREASEMSYRNSKASELTRLPRSDALSRWKERYPYQRLGVLRELKASHLAEAHAYGEAFLHTSAFCINKGKHGKHTTLRLVHDEAA